MPEAALGSDAILILATNLAAGMEVREATVARNVERVMPLMATERWLMLGVKHGGDRQTLHEVIRTHSLAARDAVEAGGPNMLLDRLAADPAFAAVDAAGLRTELDPRRYIGRAPSQVVEFVEERLDPLLESYEITDNAGVTV